MRGRRRPQQQDGTPRMTRSRAASDDPEQAGEGCLVVPELLDHLLQRPRTPEGDSSPAVAARTRAAQASRAAGAAQRREVAAEAAADDASSGRRDGGEVAVQRGTQRQHHTRSSTRRATAAHGVELSGDSLAAARQRRRQLAAEQQESQRQLALQQVAPAATRLLRPRPQRRVLRRRARDLDVRQAVVALNSLHHSCGQHHRRPQPG